MNFIKSCRADVTGGCWPLLTYYNAVILTNKNQLRIVSSGRRARPHVDNVLPYQFLPRDAMLARYMLSSCVRLSVCAFARLLTHERIVAKCLITGIRQPTPYDSAGTLTFW